MAAPEFHSDDAAGSAQRLPAKWLAPIRDDLRTAGFDRVGATPLTREPAADAEHYREWVGRGYGATMDYLTSESAIAKRLDPCANWPWARSAIVATYPYDAPEHPPALSVTDSPDASSVTIARYAAGEDYHRMLERALKPLCRAWAQRWPGFRARYYVDTGPILERQWAERAGLGWRGKNTLLLDRERGSFFFLAVILTNAEVADAPEVSADHCGSCTACLDACPTQAFPAPYVLDARRCLSYLTIEHRGAHTPDAEPLAARHNDGWLFGCDICQSVCPYNRRAPARARETPAPPASPRDDEHSVEGVAGLTLVDLLELDDEAFRARFRHTALWRARREGLRRNALYALAALSRDSPAWTDPRVRAAISAAIDDDDQGVRAAARAAHASCP